MLLSNKFKLTVGGTLISLTKFETAADIGRETTTVTYISSVELEFDIIMLLKDELTIKSLDPLIPSVKLLKFLVIPAILLLLLVFRIIHIL
jgi:hypothetical protein